MRYRVLCEAKNSPHKQMEIWLVPIPGVKTFDEYSRDEAGKFFDKAVAQAPDQKVVLVQVLMESALD